MLEPPLFRHCPRCGAARGVTDDGRAFACAGCGFRYFHNVASSVAALVVHAGALLVTRRAHAPAAGTLDLPGGFVDPGETPEAALARELAEELGWATLPAPPRYLCAEPNTYEFAGVRYATCDIVFRLDVDARIAVHAGDDVAACAWLPLAELDPSAFGMRSVRAVLAAL